jgi:oligopeptide/dipeptide ABC transporter ATP-binding protein
MFNSLLQIKDLRTYFYRDGDVIPAVDGVDLEIGKREVLGLVGESGCGKSILALSITRLIPSGAKIESGKVLFEGKDLFLFSEDNLREIRGGKISYIFQEPSTSLNPLFTIGNQILEAIELHQKKRGKEALDYAVRLLEQVKMPQASERINSYPHQLSGGMKQRAMVAMALAAGPQLLIADEPTTALDMTIQAQILELLLELKINRGISILLITHDFSILSQVADKIAVMYAGRILEYGPVNVIRQNPRHPYTQGLIGCIPKLGESKRELISIPGTIPHPLNLPKGCKFNPRCSLADEFCRREEPIIQEVETGHWVRCYKT